MRVNERFQRFAVVIFCAAITACGGSSNIEDPGFGLPVTQEIEIGKTTAKLIIHPWYSMDELAWTDWLETIRQEPPEGYKAKDSKAAFVPSPANKNHKWTVVLLNKKKLLLRMSCQSKRDNGHARFVDFITPAKKEMDVSGLTQFVSAGDEILEKLCDERTRTARRSAILGAIRTEPGKGVKKRQVKRVLTYPVDGRSGDFVTYDIHSMVLFKDGWALRNASVPIADLNIEASKALQPNKWFKWRKRWGKYQFKSVDAKEWRKFKNPLRAKPARRKLKLNDYYDYHSASGSMIYGASTYSASYTFKKDGTYTSSSSSLMGSGTWGSLAGMPSSTVAGYCNEKGGSSVASIIGAYSTAYSKKERPECGDGKSGKYLIDGYMITLEANNGVTRRLPFYRHRDWIVIGDQYYAPENDKE